MSVCGYACVNISGHAVHAGGFGGPPPYGGGGYGGGEGEERREICALRAMTMLHSLKHTHLSDRF